MIYSTNGINTSNSANYFKEYPTIHDVLRDRIFSQCHETLFDSNSTLNAHTVSSCPIKTSNVVTHNIDVKDVVDISNNNKSKESKSLYDILRHRFFIEHAPELADSDLRLVKIKNSLAKDSPYIGLLDKYKGKDIFENIRQAPDQNGVRGKTPLAGSPRRLKYSLKKLAKSNIRTVIDLREAGECKTVVLELLKQYGIQYVNFPVKDKNWTQESLDAIIKYIKAINKGDFMVGCANGESRTDLAMAINYIFNPNAKNVPDFYFGTAASSRVSITENIKKILSLLEANPKKVLELGWKSSDEVLPIFFSRLSQIVAKLKIVK